MHVRMMRQRRSPGMQDQGGANLRTQMLGVGGDGAQGLGGHIEQQVIEYGLVVIGDGGNGGGQSEHYVVVLHRQQFGLTGLEPTVRGARLALGAVPVAAGVVGDLDLLTGLAAQHMPAQRRAAALFDGRHHLELS